MYNATVKHRYPVEATPGTFIRYRIFPDPVNMPDATSENVWSITFHLKKGFRMYLGGSLDSIVIDSDLEQEAPINNTKWVVDGNGGLIVIVRRSTLDNTQGVQTNANHFYESVFRRVYIEARTFTSLSQLPFQWMVEWVFDELAFDNGRYYRVMPTEMNYGKCMALCASQKMFRLTGYTATITSDTEQQFVKDTLVSWNIQTGINIKLFLLGASNHGNATGWRWDTGPENGTVFSATDYARWSLDYHVFAPCAVVMEVAAGYKWKAALTSELAGCICEFGGMPAVQGRNDSMFHYGTIFVIATLRNKTHTQTVFDNNRSATMSRTIPATPSKALTDDKALYTDTVTDEITITKSESWKGKESRSLSLSDDTQTQTMVKTFNGSHSFTVSQSKGSRSFSEEGPIDWNVRTITVPPPAPTFHITEINQTSSYILFNITLNGTQFVQTNVAKYNNNKNITFKWVSPTCILMNVSTSSAVKLGNTTTKVILIDVPKNFTTISMVISYVHVIQNPVAPTKTAEPTKSPPPQPSGPPLSFAMAQTLPPTTAQTSQAVTTSVSAVSTVATAGSPVAVTAAAMTAMLSAGPCNPKSVQQSSDSMAWVSNPAGVVFGSSIPFPVLGNLVAMVIMWCAHGLVIIMFWLQGSSLFDATVKARWPSLSTPLTTFFYHSIVYNGAIALLNPTSQNGGIFIGILGLFVVPVFCVGVITWIARQAKSFAEYDSDHMRWVSVEDSHYYLCERCGMVFDSYKFGLQGFLGVELIKHATLAFLVNLHYVSTCDVTSGISIAFMTLFVIIKAYFMPRKQLPLNVLDVLIGILQLLGMSLSYHTRLHGDVASGARSAEGCAMVYLASYIVVAIHSAVTLYYIVRARMSAPPTQAQPTPGTEEDVVVIASPTFQNPVDDVFDTNNSVNVNKKKILESKLQEKIRELMQKYPMKQVGFGEKEPKLDNNL